MTLRVTVEIVPFGNEAEKRVLDVMNISNITEICRETEYGAVADYIVKGHRRSAGFWELVRKVLNEGQPK